MRTVCQCSYILLIFVLCLVIKIDEYSSFLTLLVQVALTGLADIACCTERIVTGYGELNGKYVLHQIEKERKRCDGGCIYRRDGEEKEFCFNRIAYVDGLVVTCSASVGRYIRFS